MSIGRSVALVTTATAQTVVEALADSTANAADDASNEEEDYDGEDDPDPEDGAALSGHAAEVDVSDGGVHAGALVTIGNNVETGAVHDAHSTPKLLEETLHFLLSIVGCLVDVVIDVQQVSVG